MTTTRSAKAKAVRHQNRVRDDLRAEYPDWTQDDIRTAIMGQSGCDIILSARARRDFSFSIECKATARGWTPAYDALAQAAANDEHETIGLAIVKQDRREPLAILRWTDFLQIVSLLTSPNGAVRN